jgi:hypothetical protein
MSASPRSRCWSLRLFVGCVLLPQGACRSQVDEERLRKMAREEARRELVAQRAQASQAAQPSGPAGTPRPRNSAPPAAARTTSPPQGRSTPVPRGRSLVLPLSQARRERALRQLERIGSRIQSLADRIVKYHANGTRTPAQLKRMEASLGRMRDRRARMLQELSAAPPAGGTPTAAPLPIPRTQAEWHKAVAAGVRKLGERRYELRRSLLTQCVQASTLCKADAEWIPYASRGVLKTLRLRSVRRHGIFAAVGLRPGDSLVGIAGSSVGYFAGVSDLVVRLLFAETFQLALSREGQPLTITYVLSPRAP